jgi:hypothetical protein
MVSILSEDKVLMRETLEQARHHGRCPKNAANHLEIAGPRPTRPKNFPIARDFPILSLTRFADQGSRRRAAIGTPLAHLGIALHRAPHVNAVAGVGIAALMGTQSFLGLVFPQWYRDVEWIRTTWFGNDLVTAVTAVPLMLLGTALSRQGSLRGTLLWLGVLGYAIYNYAFYLFGAALNVFFPLYIAAFLASSFTLLLAVVRLDAQELPALQRSGGRVRLVGVFLGVVGAALPIVWLSVWAAYVFAGRPTPVEPEAFKLVAALDCVSMAPALFLGGLWLWRGHAWGYVLAAIASTQGSLYLLVLSVNAAIFVQRGMAQAPGELILWGTLAALTSSSAILLLVHAPTPRLTAGV